MYSPDVSAVDVAADEATTIGEDVEVTVALDVVDSVFTKVTPGV